MKDHYIQTLAGAFFGDRKPEKLKPSYALEIIRSDRVQAKYRLPYQYTSTTNRRVAAEIFAELGDDINLVLQDLGYMPHLFDDEVLKEGSWKIGYCS